MFTAQGFNERRLALDNCVVDLYVCLYLSMHLSVCVCINALSTRVYTVAPLGLQ